ncbi:MAG: RNA polymerase sigma factor [Bryobacteraceae bacterium]
MYMSAIVVRCSFCRTADLAAANSQTAGRSGGLQNVKRNTAARKRNRGGPGAVVPMAGHTLTSPDDSEAVQAVLDGDVGAFESIVERWKRPLVNLAYRYCFDRGRAEDLAQEAFLRAFRNLRSCGGTRPSPPGCSRWRRISIEPS